MMKFFIHNQCCLLLIFINGLFHERCSLHESCSLMNEYSIISEIHQNPPKRSLACSERVSQYSCINWCENFCFSLHKENNLFCSPINSKFNFFFAVNLWNEFFKSIYLHCNSHILFWWKKYFYRVKSDSRVSLWVFDSIFDTIYHNPIWITHTSSIVLYSKLEKWSYISRCLKCCIFKWICFQSSLYCVPWCVIVCFFSNLCEWIDHTSTIFMQKTHTFYNYLI